jgi:hypothetical protein
MILKRMAMGEMSSLSMMDVRRAGENPESIATQDSSVVMGKSWVSPRRFQKMIWGRV